MQATIGVEDLTMRYGNHLAVDHISFDVFAGEIFGFLGPNGAGKTSTQRMLTGVLPPTDGTARVLDHDMARAPVPAKEHIGVVPEVANPYMEMSGWQNMLLAGELYGLPSRRLRERTELLLTEFQLWDRMHDPAKRYSKGMRQRLILAMALIHEPDVLFLDEPTAGLDVESRRLIHDKVTELPKRGVAVFYTTHNIEEANVLCNRVAIICRGRLVALDTPEALKATFGGSQSVVVAFNRHVEAQDLARLDRVTHVAQEGDKLRIYTPSPGAVVMQVVDFARRANMEITSLNTLGPSLEEVFVSLSSGQRPAQNGE